jgi:uncharacterized protein involved in exopolysaccharide biosynthesis
MSQQAVVSEAGQHRAMNWPVLQLLSERRLEALGIPLAAAIVVLAITLVWPRTYTAMASFVPQQSPGNLSRLSSIAAQFGVQVPTTDQAQSPQFYADLVRSDMVLRTLVRAMYVDSARGREPIPIVSEIDVKGDGPKEREELAIRRLRNWLSASVNLRTGVVSISVQTRQPALSVAIVKNVIEEVERFNLRTRRSQSGAERRFVEGRLAQSLEDLRAAEEKLQSFYQANREYRTSSRLTFAAERLQREVDRYQQVYTLLQQSFEQARINEVRDTPVTTIVEPPAQPVLPDSRHALAKTVLAGVVGLFPVIVLTVLRRNRSGRGVGA